MKSDRLFFVGTRLTLCLSSAWLASPRRSIAQHHQPVPAARGLSIVSVLQFPEGDRESVVTITDSSAEGLTYQWRARESRRGAAEQAVAFTRFVRTADLLGAPRLNTVYLSGDRKESPGYTAFTLSAAVFDQMVAGDTASYANAVLQGPVGFGVVGLLDGLMSTRLLFKGTLSRARDASSRFPVLVNGRRAMLPVLHLRGRFALREHTQVVDFWVLAYREHPLLLKIAADTDVWQVVRIDVPGRASPLESELVARCSAEISGLHFAFNSAELEESSRPALERAAEVLRRNATWKVIVEGHTDSVGNAAANLQLSQRRAEAVRLALIRDGVAAERIASAGHGAGQPRESNSTVEGRASNRRVELVRRCTTNAR